MPLSANSSTTSKWLHASTTKLEKTGIATARLDCLVLLEDVTGKERSYILAHPENQLTSEQVSKLASKIERRAKHEPLAYLRGKSEFYGREFMVTPDTLEPRPETETMISQFLSLIQDSLVTDEENVNWTIVDVGTGSGCIGTTVKLEVPQTMVFATEINPDALMVAKKNAKNLSADVEFIQGNLLEPFYNLEPLTSNLVLLCNLPYVPDSHTINEAAMYEPKVAIFGGSDGLDLYRKLFQQIDSNFLGDSIKNWNRAPRYILTESLPFQHEELMRIAKSAHYKLAKTEDFIQVFSR